MTGSVFEAGDRLSISGTLVDTSTGEEVATGTVQGTEDEIFKLVDDMTMALIANLAATEGGRLMQIAALTTDSLEALKSYLLGQQLLRAGQFTGALEAFERQLDSDGHTAVAGGGDRRFAYGRQIDRYVALHPVVVGE